MARKGASVLGLAEEALHLEADTSDMERKDGREEAVAIKGTVVLGSRGSVEDRAGRPRR
jgi:hypothetical protein